MAFAVNSTTIDGKCRLLLLPDPGRAHPRDLFRVSLDRRILQGRLPRKGHRPFAVRALPRRGHPLPARPPSPAQAPLTPPPARWLLTPPLANSPCERNVGLAGRTSSLQTELRACPWVVAPENRVIAPEKVASEMTVPGTGSPLPQHPDGALGRRFEKRPGSAHPPKPPLGLPGAASGQGPATFHLWLQGEILTSSM